MAETVDVVVVGMGPGGEALAGRLAEAGLAVVGVDRRLVGGECPYYGCVPSKMMIRAGDALTEGRRVPLLAGSSRIDADWSPVAARIRDEATDDWDDSAAVERFTAKGGRFVRGGARLTGPHTVTVDSPAGELEFVASRAIVLNTGTEPAVPPIPGLADAPYWTNRDAVRTTTVPESLVVIGGGAIGAELTQVFARFGSRVSVVEAVPRLLPFEEPEAGALIAEVFAHEGIDVRVGAAMKSVEFGGDGFTVEVGDARIDAEKVLVATGRRTELKELGIDQLGLDASARFVSPDERMRIADGVYAIGDITGKGAFTHMSMYQSAIAARDILGEPGFPAEYHAVPRVTFTDPEVGSVGLTEAQARENGLNVLVGVTQIPNSSRGFIHKVGNEGFIKLVADADRGVLVGATSVGPNGGEVLSALAVAVHAGVTTERLKQMIYAYPTFHRAIEDALHRLA